MNQKRRGLARTYYRRDHEKPDGRMMYLYGYHPHSGKAGTEFTDPVSSLCELRYHPLRQDWAVHAPHRQNRTFKPSKATNPLAPARPGAEITEIPFDAFELAIFGNRFPSFHPEAPLPSDSLPWRTDQAKGDAEVIVFSDQDTGSLATIGQERRILLIEALIDRYEHHFNSGAAYVLPFENRGEAVGVTLSHPHGQLYAFPFVPEPQAKAEAAFTAGYDLEADRQNWADTLSIDSQANLHAYAPAFSRFPYEVWISSQKRHAGPWSMTQEEIEGLAFLMGDVVARYDRLFEQDMPYMMSFQAAPRDTQGKFQFTVQFYPIMRAPGRLKYLASVEQATGVFTVDVDPAMAAKTLKEV